MYPKQQKVKKFKLELSLSGKDSLEEENKICVFQETILELLKYHCFFKNDPWRDLEKLHVHFIIFL